MVFQVQEVIPGKEFYSRFRECSPGINGVPVLEKVPKITRNDDREARSKELEWGELRCLSKGSKCLTSPVPLTPISFAVLIPCSFGNIP